MVTYNITGINSRGTTVYVVNQVGDTSYDRARAGKFTAIDLHQFYTDLTYYGDTCRLTDVAAFNFHEE